MVEFIYFDLGNVICLFDHQIACAKVARLVDSTADEVRQVLLDGDLQARYEMGRLNSSQFVAELNAAFEREVAEDLLLHAVSDMFRVNLPVVVLIERLRQSGRRRLGVLSNTCEAHWNFCCEQYSIHRFFDVFALSYQLGSLKPDPEIYRRAADLAGLPTKSIFFTDDRADNVAAAKAAGFIAHQFVGAEELERELKSVAS
ncbi:MAG: HAD family phosphatase [Pirellulaceae bacterium]|jgi:HAD superfamily hydrolase (TIGR01509 family)|nr:HAD family phosphatase [Pirellulaceae bacterium]MDP7016363.1 HAD family phosphatase [Pirellulaceae bacterium]